MNNQNKPEEDIVRQYLDPESIERAPEGFTSRVMTQILLEDLPQKNSARLWSLSYVPLVSVTVTILLIVTALLTPGSQEGIFFYTATNFIRNLDISFPDISISSLVQPTFSTTLFYTIIGIFILTIFDRALSSFFHKEK